MGASYPTPPLNGYPQHKQCVLQGFAQLALSHRLGAVRL